MLRGIHASCLPFSLDSTERLQKQFGACLIALSSTQLTSLGKTFVLAVNH